MQHQHGQSINTSACDRCHRQKLRCIRNNSREEDERGACERCTRASIHCVTTERKRTGRPAKKKDETNFKSFPHTQRAELLAEATSHGIVTAKDMESSRTVPREVDSNTNPAEMAPTMPLEVDWFNGFEAGDAQYMESFDEMDFSNFQNMDHLDHIQADTMEVSAVANTVGDGDMTKNSSTNTSPNEQAPEESVPVYWRESTVHNDMSNSTTHSSSITSLPSNGTFLPRAEWLGLNAKCTAKLTKLISDLFRDIEMISNGEIRAILSTPPAAPAQPLGLRSTTVVIDRTEKHHYPIAEILLSCKRLVEILRVIEFLYPTELEGDGRFNSNQNQFPSFPRIELPTLLALFTAYSTLVQCSELVVNIIHLALIEHIKTPDATPQISLYRQMEVVMLCRVLWRMLTLNELGILALRNRKIDGLAEDSETFFSSAMLSLGRRAKEDNGGDHERMVARGIERVAGVLYGIDIRMI